MNKFNIPIRYIMNSSSFNNGNYIEYWEYKFSINRDM